MKICRRGKGKGKDEGSGVEWNGVEGEDEGKG